MAYNPNYHPVPYSSPSPHPGRPDFNPYNSYHSTAKETSPGLDASSPSLTPTEARFQAEKEGTTLSIVLFSLAVFTAVIGATVLLLVLIFVLNTFEREGLSIKTSADLQNLLTISQIVTTVVSKSVAIVIFIHAYQLAGEWIKASDRRNGERPSPLQLGLLISVLQGANIIAWFKVRWHLLRGTREGKRQTLQPAPILTRAVTVLGFLLFLSYATTGLDTWLHLSSKATPIAHMTSYSGSAIPEYGKQLNETRCAEHAQLDPVYGDTCFQEMSIHDAFAYSIPEGLQTLTNTSETNLVATTDDGEMAIITPAFIEKDVMYEATTVGVGSTCISITDQCLTPIPHDTYTEYGDNFVLYLNCLKASPPVNITVTGQGASFTDTAPFSFVYPNNGSFNWPTSYGEYGYIVTTNPINIAALVQSFAYNFGGDGDDYFVNNTGFFKHGRNGAENVIYCNTTVYDVKYRYLPSPNNDGGTYHTLSSTLSTARLTRLVAIGLDMNVIQRYMPSRIEGTGLRVGSYTTAFAQRLSTELMALSAAMYEPVPVTAVANSSYVIGSKVQLIPLGLYIIAVVIYAMTALIIGISALVETRSVKFVKLVHMRITSSLPIVHALFGPVDPSRTWRADAVEMYSTETEKDRLYVGPVKGQTEGDSFGFARTG